jgi:hypothetical protein
MLEDLEAREGQYGAGTYCYNMDDREFYQEFTVEDADSLREQIAAEQHNPSLER